jgi:hypothetical protein
VRNELSTGNRYFWHVWVNTPVSPRGASRPTSITSARILGELRVESPRRYE